MKIEIIPAQDVAYIRRVGPYGPENYAVMDALKSWAWSRGLLNGGVIYGIAYDSPDADPQNCRFDACIVLHDKDQELTDGIILGSLPGGCYAVFMVEHTTSAVESFWKSFIDEMEVEKLIFDDARPIMERYREDVLKLGFCEFCVPVVK